MWQQQTSIAYTADYHLPKISCDGNYLFIRTIDDERREIWKIDVYGDCKKYYSLGEYTDGGSFSKDSRFFIFNSEEMRKCVIVIALGGEAAHEIPFIPTTPEKCIHAIGYPSPDYSTVLVYPHREKTLLIYERNQAGTEYIQQNLSAKTLWWSRPFPFSQNEKFFSVRKEKALLAIWKKNNQGEWREQKTAPHTGYSPLHFNSTNSCLVTIPSPDQNKQTQFTINVMKLNHKGEWISREFAESNHVDDIRWLPGNNHFLTILRDKTINKWTIIPKKNTASTAGHVEDMQH